MFDKYNCMLTNRGLHNSMTGYFLPNACTKSNTTKLVISVKAMPWICCYG